MSIATKPNERKKGYAGNLLNEGLETAQREGYAGVILEVRAGNDPAQSLYERLGFMHTATLPRWFQNPVEDGEVWVKMFL